MKKKSKIIASTIGAVTLGSAIITATVAQSCTTPTPVNRAELVLAAFRALDGVSVSPEDPNQEALYEALEGAITPGAIISNISITNPTNSISSNEDGSILTVVQNSIFISTTLNGSNDQLFGNFNDVLTISDIVFTNSTITSVGSVTGFSSRNSDQEVALTAFRSLDGINTPPEQGTNARFLYNSLEQEILSNDSGATITAIEINTPSNSVTATTDGATIMVSPANIIITTTNNNVVTTYANSRGDLIISGIIFSEGVIIGGGTSSGLFSQSTNQEIAQNTFRSLNGITEPPTQNTSQRTYFVSMLAEINDIDPNAEISRITITTPSSTVTANADATILTVLVNSIVIQTTGGNGSTYSNSVDNLVISNLNVNQGTVVSADVSTGLVEQSDQNIAVNAFRGLANIQTIPTNINILAFYDAIQSFIQITAPLETISTITIVNAENSVTANANGTEIMVAQNSISIATLNGNATLYNNSAGIMRMSNVIIQNGVITSGGQVSGLGSTNRELIELAFRGLNNAGPGTPTNANEGMFFNMLNLYISSTLGNGGAIDTISITNPDINVIADSDTSLTISANNITVTTSGGTDTDFTNSGVFTITGIVIVDGIITSAGTFSGLSPV